MSYLLNCVIRCETDGWDPVTPTSSFSLWNYSSERRSVHLYVKSGVQTKSLWIFSSWMQHKIICFQPSSLNLVSQFSDSLGNSMTTSPNTVSGLVACNSGYAIDLLHVTGQIIFSC